MMMTEQATVPSINVILNALPILRPSGNLLLVAICPRKAEPIRSRGFDMPSEAAQAAEWALDLNLRLKMNLYFTVNLTGERHKKAGKAEMHSAVAFWADCDPNVFRYGGYDKARDYLLSNTVPALQGKATYAIDSGNGISPFFALQDAIEIKGDYASYEALNDQVGKVWSGATTHNCDRVMRLPGTWNYPNDAKIGKGYPSEPRLAKLLFSGGPTYTMDGVREMVRRRELDNRFWSFINEAPAVAARYSGSTEGLQDKSGSAMDFSMVAMLKMGGFEKEEIRELLATWQHGSASEQRGTDRYWARCWENATPETSFNKKPSQSQHPTPSPPQIPVVHPYAQFIQYSLKSIEPDEFILDDLLISGVTLLAGFTGIGKTTALVPLMAKVAHLCPVTDTLKPTLKRRVIYVTEDHKQVTRILTSMKANGELPESDEELADWFRIVPAKRMDAQAIVKVRDIYEGLSFRNVDTTTGATYDAKPIVVLDTSNATIELDNESDNSEVGKAVSTLKSAFSGIPLIIVTHLAKTLKKAEISDMTSRGAGAWEGDVNQVLYMTKEDNGDRWLDVAQAKHRFITKADGVMFKAINTTIKGHDILGNDKTISLMHCQPELVLLGGLKIIHDSIKEAVERGKEAAQHLILNDKKKRVEAILDALKNGDYLTKNELCESVGGKRSLALDAIGEMINDGEIEIFTPTNKRKNQHQEGLRLSAKPQQESYEESSRGK